MKKLIILLLFIFPLIIKAQPPVPKFTAIHNAQAIDWVAGMKYLGIPYGPTLTLNATGRDDQPALFYLTSGSTGLYYWDALTSTWIKISATPPVVFDATVDFSVNTDPNDVGTTFNPNTPMLTTKIYVSTINGSQWTWNGTAYVTYNSLGWGIFGNYGTDPSTNFIGTTDNKDLRFRVGNTHAGLININRGSTSFGLFSMITTPTGYYNTAFGNQTMQYIAGGQYNTAVGVSAAGAVVNGDDNTAIGMNAYGAGEGDKNTAIGSNALGSTTSGSGNIGIGYAAGNQNTTGSNQFFLNNFYQSNYTNDQTKSLVYGIFDADPVNQELYFNSNVFTPYYTNHTSQNRVLGMISGTGQHGYLTLGAGLAITAGVLNTTGGGGIVARDSVSALSPIDYDNTTGIFSADTSTADIGLVTQYQLEQKWGIGGNPGITPSNLQTYIGYPDSVRTFQARINNQSAMFVSQPHTWLTQAPLDPTPFGFPGGSLTALGYRANQATINKILAGQESVTGYNNVAIGNYALANVGSWVDVDSSLMQMASATTAVGSWALTNLQGGQVSGDYGRTTGVGSLAMFMAVSAQGSSAFGSNSMERALKGINNTGIGVSALRTVGNGIGNTAVGAASGYFVSGYIDKVNVTAGGSGYTTATVTIDPPKTFAQPNMPYINENPAHATAVIVGGVITEIIVTDPGVGYVADTSINHTHGTWLPPTVTITGDGTGATASAVVTASSYNTFIGTQANWKNRGGHYNTGLGYLTGGGQIRTRDTSTTFLGYGAQPVSGSAALKNATAVGALSMIGVSNGISLGDTASVTNVGIGTAYPDQTSLLDVKSTARGVLIPRLNTTQQNAISSPATGLIIWNTDTLGLVSYTGLAWRKYAMGDENYWTLSGTDIYRLSDVSIGKVNAGTDSTFHVTGSMNITGRGVINGINIKTSLPATAFPGMSIGYNAGPAATHTGIQNHLIGTNSGMHLTTGTQNTAIGYNTLYSDTAVTNTIAIGHNAMRGHYVGIGNIGIGYEAMYNTGLTGSGNYNVGIGGNAIKNFTSGSSNTGVGQAVFGLTTTGSNNTAMGYLAGGTNTTGSENIYIGFSANGASATGSQQLNIGGWIKGDSGRLAIGGAYSEPSAILDVKGTTRGMLIPRLTTTEQNAIVSPANGLTIYNTDSSDYVVYKSSAWRMIGNTSTPNLQQVTASGNTTTLDVIHDAGTGNYIKLTNDAMNPTLESHNPTTGVTSLVQPERFVLGNTSWGKSIIAGSLTANRNLTLPDATGTFVLRDDVATISNKRWTARVGSAASSGTPTINTDNFDIYKLTAQAADITSFTTNLTGTPVDGDILEIQITDNGTPRAITWGASFVASSVALPTTTVASTTLSTVFQFFTTSSYGNNKWICVNSF